MPPSSPSEGSLLSGVFGRGRGAPAGGAPALRHAQRDPEAARGRAAAAERV